MAKGRKMQFQDSRIGTKEAKKIAGEQSTNKKIRLTIKKTKGNKEAAPMKRKCLDCTAFGFGYGKRNISVHCGGVHPPTIEHICRAFEEAPQKIKVEKNNGLQQPLERNTGK